MGTALFLGGATLFNHSCSPNCEVEQLMPSLRVATLRDVEAAEPLTVSYLEQVAHMPVRMRQARLQGQYGFACRCPRCVLELEKIKPRTPPKWLANCHRRGDHYLVAVAMYAANVPLHICFLTLLIYFVMWVRVCRFPL